MALVIDIENFLESKNTVESHWKGTSIFCENVIDIIS